MCVFGVGFSCLLWWVFVCLFGFGCFFFFLFLTLLQRYGLDYAYWSIQGEKLLQFLCCSGGFCSLLWNAGEINNGSMDPGGVYPVPYPMCDHPGRWWWRRGWQTGLNFITFLFCSFEWCHFNIDTLFAHGKTVKALRHQQWAVMLVCPRWLVWCMDLSPCFWVARAQWGNTLAVHAAGNRGVSPLLESRVYFSFGTWF